MSTPLAVPLLPRPMQGESAAKCTPSLSRFGKSCTMPSEATANKLSPGCVTQATLPRTRLLGARFNQQIQFVVLTAPFNAALFATRVQFTLVDPLVPYGVLPFNRQPCRKLPNAPLPALLTILQLLALA